MANNGPLPTVTRWKPQILAAAKRWGVDPSLLAGLIQHESGGREGLTSSANAKGLTQFIPSTAATYHVNTSPGHALSQIMGTAHYLHDLKAQEGGSTFKALEAYGAGPGNLAGGSAYASQDLALAKNYRGLDGQTLPAPSAPGASGTRVRTIPGTDNSAARRDLIAQFVLSGGPSNDSALVGLASGLQGAQDTPSRTVKVKSATTAPGTPGAPSGAPSGSGNYPLGKHGKIIGIPYQGTHGKAFNVSGGSDNWQSENAVDIAVPIGTPVYAVADGTLGNTGSLGQGGRFAGLRTNLIGANNSWYYAHLSKLAAGIRAGAHVQKGQLLGWTGEANGVAHLHFAQENGNPRSSL